MENNNVINNEEIRNDLIEQISAEADQVISLDPIEESENEGGMNLGVIGAIAGLGAAAVTGGVVLYKKVKSGAVKQFFEDKKEQRNFKKDVYDVTKQIATGEDLEKIRQYFAEKAEKTAETSTEQATVVETKKNSKK